MRTNTVNSLGTVAVIAKNLYRELRDFFFHLVEDTLEIPLGAIIKTATMLRAVVQNVVDCKETSFLLATTNTYRAENVQDSVPKGCAFASTFFTGFGLSVGKLVLWKGLLTRRTPHRAFLFFPFLSSLLTSQVVGLEGNFVSQPRLSTYAAGVAASAWRFDAQRLGLIQSGV